MKACITLRQESINHMFAWSYSCKRLWECLIIFALPGNKAYHWLGWLQTLPRGDMSGHRMSHWWKRDCDHVQTGYSPQEATGLVTEWITDGRETVIMCIIVWVKAFQHFVYPRRTSLEGKSPAFHSIVSSPAPALWWPWSSSWLCRFSSHKNLMHSSVKLWVWSNVAQCMGLLIQHKLGTLEHILSLSLRLWFLFVTKKTAHILLSSFPVVIGHTLPRVDKYS